MIVHIVPTTPPAINGLADYCYKLWQHWPSPRPEWKCVAAQVADDAVASWPEVEIVGFELSGPGLLSALEKVGADEVVLHYVGYAYHLKGVPWWLPGALRAWKHRSQGRLTVIFHELWSRGTPKQSAFWLSPVTRKITIDLANLSDHWVITSIEAQQQLLSTGVDANKSSLIPVGASIEPDKGVDENKPWPSGEAKQLKIVLFGLPATRLDALRKHRNLLSMLIQRGLVSSICLVGQKGNPEIVQATQEVASRIGHPELWLTKYGLSSQDISEELLQADVGLVSHRPGLLTKSSIYATFCCHGLVAVSAYETGQSTESIVPTLVNFDDHPERCIELLTDSEEIRRLRGQIHETARTVLSWASIAQRWAEITL